MPLPLHVPAGAGLAALDELAEVPWRMLDHAYGKGVIGKMLHEDVARTLAALGVPDDFDHAIDTLYANVCHQGTVYEATAYAVPFLAAVAGAELSARRRRRLVDLLCAIAIAAGHDTDDGTRSGALGDGVGELIRSAYEHARAQLVAIAAREPAARATIDALLAYAAEPETASFAAMREAFVAWPKPADDDAAAPAPRGTDSGERYRHAKLGDATLVRRSEAGLVLRFDDGRERTIREAFVTRLA